MTTGMLEDFLARIETRDLTVGVVGLGYVGLPLVIGFAEKGYRAVGFDVDAERTAALNDGRSHIEDVESTRVRAMVDSGRFLASTKLDDLARADAVFIAVPTPFDEAKTPDLTFVRSATEAVRDVLAPGKLVILQSTTFPGTTSEVVRPILESTGLRAGADFLLAFSPERVDPGNEVWNLRNTPKVVGGIDAASGHAAAALLQSAMDEPGLITQLSSPEAAELTKLLENTFRAVNIALVNELAVLCDSMDIDVWEVIDGAATKPFGFQAFYPGIGPGGHCIPVDPYYLSWRAKVFDFQTKFIELAADLNLSMADYVRRRVGRMLNDDGKALSGANVLCYGASFKPSVSDMRNSRAVRVIELLAEAGANVSYHDPRVPTITFGHEGRLRSDLCGTQLKSVDLTPETVDGADIVVVLVNHPELGGGEALSGARRVFDAVNALHQPSDDRVERL
ncbi:MAG: nucleotide sugar dehydrogenase [Acidimicrobiia bacterium]|nr:nucleotide sugar dehydrogenase [Acidimicrobiia bacterium]